MSLIPFDVNPTRTIQVDHKDLDSVEECKRELIKQILVVEKDPSKTDSPISTSINLQLLRQSGDPIEKSNANIISMLQEIRSIVSRLSITGSRDQKEYNIINLMFEAINSILHGFDYYLSIDRENSLTIDQRSIVERQLIIPLIELDGLAKRYNISDPYIRNISNYIDHIITNISANTATSNDEIKQKIKRRDVGRPAPK